ncbi:hypothetical protein F7734_48930 [Scytonema sp. UIC 10036]|uniref:hypothetical protein n=1 Tax=Scytonema sp. UIC 10036 TaxID=2304196 RepID=UPI0012DA43F8|nr:hypothetical protein [Scytonema sp. UIC 10036]MUG99783.1 hypothetical protein [Scytonema sp. UIC 10036]
MRLFEHIDTWLTEVVEAVQYMQQRNHDWNEESKALGLISDDEKLKMLKADLYCEARSSVSDSMKLQKLTSAIEVLEEIKLAEFNRQQAKLKHRYSFPVQLEVFSNIFIMLVITLVLGSYFAAYKCGNSRSQFCAKARVIPTQVELFFKD